jgi:hypothetical protein
LLDLVVSETQQHILGLEISVYNPADAVEEIQAHHNLTSDFLDQIERESLVLVALQNFEKVDAEYLEDHAEVVAVGPLVEEGVEEVEDVGVVAFDLLLVGLVVLERFNPLGMICITGNFL